MNKKRMQKTKTKKRAKALIIKARPRRVPNYERIFFGKQKLHAAKRHDIGIVRLQRWQTHRHYILAAVPRASITALMRVFVTIARWTAHAKKSAQSARKATKIRFMRYTRVL